MPVARSLGARLWTAGPMGMARALSFVKPRSPRVSSWIIAIESADGLFDQHAGGLRSFEPVSFLVNQTARTEKFLTVACVQPKNCRIVTMTSFGQGGLLSIRDSSSGATSVTSPVAHVPEGSCSLSDISADFNAASDETSRVCRSDAFLAADADSGDLLLVIEKIQLW